MHKEYNLLFLGGMRPPRCTDEDFIQFLIATSRTASCTEAARVYPHSDQQPPVAHDAFNRLLRRLEPDSQTLWEEVEAQVQRNRGCLVLDDSTLDKLYARQMELLSYHWSGKHQRVVKGINLLTLLWTDGERRIPCDYRIYDKQELREPDSEPDHPSEEAPDPEIKTKNDLFRELLQTAQKRGFEPQMVLFDSWYSSLDNLKLIRNMGWTFLTRLKANRKVNPEGKGLKPISQCEISESGTLVHLKGFGLVKVFRIAGKNAGTNAEPAEYWCTNELGMSDLERLMYSEWCWQIEQYHREIKQYCLVEKCQCRVGRLIRNYIQLALRAFVRLEYASYHSGKSLFELTSEIIRSAVRQYLNSPRYRLGRIV
jgi:hypothetical protein